MLNSLTVFFAFFAFLIFGYLTLIRLACKQAFGNIPGFLKALMQSFMDRNLLQNLGSSAFFVSLPAVALLLFWGWGPALIWLAVFHFFIESLSQLRYSSLKNQASVGWLGSWRPGL